MGPVCYAIAEADAAAGHCYSVSMWYGSYDPAFAEGQYSTYAFERGKIDENICTVATRILAEMVIAVRCASQEISLSRSLLLTIVKI